MIITMEQQDKINLLLEMQEYPERYTDEQIATMLDDDPELAELLEQLALAKRALAKHEADEELIPVDEQWAQFVAEHGDQLDALSSPLAGERIDTDTSSPLAGERLGVGWNSPMLRKAAAILVGVIITASIAYAATYLVRQQQKPTASAAPETEQVAQITGVDHATPVDTLVADTATVGPVIYDNIPLEQMLTEIAQYYDVEVQFHDDHDRGLRFHFVWNRQRDIDQVVSDLNHFERLQVTLNDNQLIVE